MSGSGPPGCLIQFSFGMAEQTETAVRLALSRSRDGPAQRNFRNAPGCRAPQARLSRATPPMHCLPSADVGQAWFPSTPSDSEDYRNVSALRDLIRIRDVLPRTKGLRASDRPWKTRRGRNAGRRPALRPGPGFIGDRDRVVIRWPAPGGPAVLLFGKVPRGLSEPSPAYRAAVLPQQTALRRPGCLRAPPEQGTRRGRASRRGVLRPALPRTRRRPAAAPAAEPGPVPGRGPVPHAGA